MRKNRHRTLDSFIDEHLKENPDQVDDFLQTALEEYENDRDETALLLALRHVVKAKGGMQALSQNTNIPRESLYRMLSPSGNPTLKNLQRIMECFGYTLTFKRLETMQQKFESNR